MIVVDTNVWSELIRDEPEQRVLAWEKANAPLLWMSTVVLAEFRARAVLLPEGKRRDRIARLIEDVVATHADRLLPFDELCAREYGPVLLSARKAGAPIGSADAMIAATARAHHMSVATRNTNDFAGAGVSLIDPWQT